MAITDTTPIPDGPAGYTPKQRQTYFALGLDELDEMLEAERPAARSCAAALLDEMLDQTAKFFADATRVLKGARTADVTLHANEVRCILLTLHGAAGDLMTAIEREIHS